MKSILAGAVAVLVLAGASVGVFHRRAAAPELRHSRVAEGNASRAVQAMWSRGADGYAEVLSDDAHAWGRVRPVHWLYQSASFFVTLVRNGDLTARGASAPMSGRINGDLQTCALVQMAAVALSLAALGWLAWRLTGTALAAVLLPAVFAACGGFSLAENLLVNFVDSGEIGQLLFICLYLLCIEAAFRGRVPTVRQEVCAAGLLVLAYGMKETTLALLPAAFAVLGLRSLPALAPEAGFRRFAVRHAAVHVLMACVLLGFVQACRTGAYVADNYRVDGGLAESVARSWILLAFPADVSAAAAASLAVCVGALAAERRRAGRLPVPETGGAWTLLAACAALAAGFWALNLPWAAPLRKYYLPVHFFASACTAILAAAAGASLARQGLRPAAWMWGLGLVAFAARELPDHRLAVSRFYRQQYEYRKTVPAIAADIATLAGPGRHSLDVRIVDGHRFQEGALPFLRTVNRVHRLNIARGRDIVSTLPAMELNYFRIRPGAPAVEMTLSRDVSRASGEDVVYLLDPDPGDETAARAAGFTLGREWSVGNPGLRVARYARP